MADKARLRVTTRLRRWSPRLLPTAAVIAFSAAFIGWAAAGPTPRPPSPEVDAVSPAPSRAVTVVPSGTASAPTEPGISAPVAPAHQTTRPTATTGPPPVDRSIFTRTDPAPNGVPAQIGPLPGGDGCSGVERPGPPVVVTDSRPQQRPIVAPVCVLNFDPTLPVRITVTPAGGPLRTSVVPPAHAAAFDASFLIGPGDPLGFYHVTAEQGDAVAVADVLVTLSDEPRIFRHPEKRVTAGGTIDLLLAGFPSGRPAILHLYGTDGSQASYRTSFTVPVDEHGDAAVTLSTPSSLRSGCYVFATDAVRTSANALRGSAVSACVVAR